MSANADSAAGSGCGALYDGSFDANVHHDILVFGKVQTIAPSKQWRQRVPRSELAFVSSPYLPCEAVDHHFLVLLCTFCTSVLV